MKHKFITYGCLFGFLGLLGVYTLSQLPDPTEGAKAAAEMFMGDPPTNPNHTPTVFVTVFCMLLGLVCFVIAFLRKLMGLPNG